MDMQAYPQFRALQLADAGIFDRAFARRAPEISEFTFTNLYAWRGAYKLQAAVFEQLLIVRSDAEKQKRFFEPIGVGDIRGAVEYILKDTGAVFIRIPETTKALFDGDSRYRVEPDPDNSDYVFRMQDLVNLAGRKYDGKRNLIKKFKSAYSYEYIRLDSSSVSRALEFEEAWCSIKDCDSVTGLNNERQAIREMVNNFSAFNLRAGAVQTGGVIRALAIGQKLKPDTLVMHVLKADPAAVGLYQTMCNEFLAREGSDCDYVNLEQDLGVEGLRKAKLSYHPAAMIRKYTLKKSDG